MRRRALILCSVVVAGCSSATVSSSGATEGSTTTSAVTTTSTTATSTSTSTSTTSTTSTTTTVTPTTVTLTTAPATREPTPAERAVTDQLSRRALALMATDVHAIGFAVTDHDSVIGTLAVGNRPNGRPLEADAPFRIASISKMLTSTVVLQLADEGALHLDDRLRDLGIVPPAALDPRVGDVTVRQLLQHTSGIGKFRDQFFGTAATDWHTAANLALVSPLAALPGTTYAYSNANFAILGVLVERLTGQPLDIAVRERVLDPLDISNATLSTATGVLDPDGPAYVINPTRRYMEALGPAGAWVIAPGDLVRIVAALQPDSTTPLVSPTMLAEMRTPTALFDDEPDWSYGLGLMVFPWAYGHTGTIEDVRTFALALPNGYSIVVLSAGKEVPSGEDLITSFAPEVMLLAALAGR